MRLRFVCIDNVHHFDAARFQIIRDERAMTTPPNRFCAHDRGRPSLASESEKALDAFVELLCLHVIGVAAK